MTPRELLARLGALGCDTFVRQEGSHRLVQCAECRTVVAMHSGRDIPKGTLGKIRRDLSPCLGKDFLTKEI